MKQRIFITSLLLSSLFGYLSLFGSGLFIFQMEKYTLENLQLSDFSDGLRMFHPLTSMSSFEFVPIIGQAVVAMALVLSFTKIPVGYKVLSFVGILFLLVPFCLIFYIGIDEGNFKMIASTIPFFSISGLLLWSFKNKK